MSAVALIGALMPWIIYGIGWYFWKRQRRDQLPLPKELTPDDRDLP